MRVTSTRPCHALFLARDRVRELCLNPHVNIHNDTGNPLLCSYDIIIFGCPSTQAPGKTG